MGGEQVEGRQAVRELLLAGRRRVHEVLVEQRGPREDDEILALCSELGVAVRSVTRSAFEAAARTDAPQGVLARASALDEVSLDDLLEGEPFLMVVDGVTDPGNLGAMLRTAECAGVTGIVLARHRAVHVTPTVAKAAAGAIEHLPMALVGGIPSALATLAERGVWVVGLDAAGSMPVHDLEVASQGVALVFGAEGRGLGRLVRQRCDVVASIPLRGQLGSLNVAAAAAVACFAVAHHRPPEV